MHKQTESVTSCLAFIDYIEQPINLCFGPGKPKSYTPPQKNQLGWEPSTSREQLKVGRKMRNAGIHVHKEKSEVQS